MSDIKTVADLKQDGHNANKGTAQGQKAIVGSIQRSGAGRSIVVDKHNRIIGGNKTAEAIAETLGTDSEVIVIESTGEKLVVHKRLDLDLDDPDPNNPARQLAYADNMTSWASFDLDPAQVMTDIEAGFDFEAIDIGLPDLGEMLGDPQFGKSDNTGQDTEAQVDRAKELQEKWGTELGQLWQLGEHRLICGDCTDSEVVARVMNGEKAEMVFADPPYGVAVGDKNKFLNSIAPSNRVEENLQNDNVDEPELMAMLSAAFDNAISACLAGGAWYVAAPPGPLHVLFGQLLKERGIWRQTIQWVKNNATFSPLGVDYHWQAEPIFYGWLPGAGHRYYGGRQQTTVWEIDRPLKSPEHPTMKPVALAERAVVNSSKEGEIVLDPFLGSGTTLIACENLSRRCRAIEIDPGYVAVSLQRWADHTGKTPELLDTWTL